MIGSTIPHADVLHTEGKWELVDATNNKYYTGVLDWQSVIRHYCDALNLSYPYWMLLERAGDPTRCEHCRTPIPESIVALFKLQNWEYIT